MNPLDQIPASELEWLATATSDDPLNPALHNVYSFVVDNEPWAVATDTYRMHMTRVDEPWAGAARPDDYHDPHQRADQVLALAEQFIRTEPPKQRADNRIRTPRKWLSKVVAHTDRFQRHSTTEAGLYHADGTPHDPVDLYRRVEVLVRCDRDGWTAGVDRTEGLERLSTCGSVGTHKAPHVNMSVMFNADKLFEAETDSIWHPKGPYDVWLFRNGDRAGGVMPFGSNSKQIH